MDGIKILLLDIEGTITPISFVKDKLFGYVRQNLIKHLNERYDEQEVKNDIKDLIVEFGCLNLNIDSDDKDKIIKLIVPEIFSLMDQDRKSTALKQLQGHMFYEAFQSKAVTGELFTDVLPSLKKLKGHGIQLAIYSSGSIFSQKLLFGHTEEGDITELFSGFFDTTSGAKVESSSYLNISQQLGVKPEEVLFMTDLPKEARAATHAGCKVYLVLRDGNAPVSEDDLERYPSISSFYEINVPPSR